VGDREILVQVAPDVPSVYADRELIELTLRQLVDNALKYSGARSPVRLSAELEEGRVVASVSDKGPGIPETLQERIFEKLYRGSNSRHHVPGAGMGLAIAKEIIHAHGGELWVDSVPGEGSTFRFSLQVAPHGGAV
jgi:signal transduction histidine kinase